MRCGENLAQFLKYHGKVWYNFVVPNSPFQPPPPPPRSPVLARSIGRGMRKGNGEVGQGCVGGRGQGTRREGRSRDCDTARGGHGQGHGRDRERGNRQNRRGRKARQWQGRCGELTTCKSSTCLHNMRISDMVEQTTLNNYNISYIPRATRRLWDGGSGSSKTSCNQERNNLLNTRGRPLLVTLN